MDTAVWLYIILGNFGLQEAKHITAYQMLKSSPGPNKDLDTVHIELGTQFQ